jgi:hypothetical protein
MKKAPFLPVRRAHRDDGDGFGPERREDNDDHSTAAHRPDRLEPFVPNGSHDRIHKEFELQVCEVQSMLVQIGETLGVIPGDDLFYS